MIKEKMDLDIQVARLRTLKAAYNSQHYRLEDAVTGMAAMMGCSLFAGSGRLRRLRRADADGTPIVVQDNRNITDDTAN